MKRAIAILYMFGVLYGCGGDDARLPVCDSYVGEAITYNECGGKRLPGTGIYCVDGCTSDKIGMEPNGCTLPVFGPPHQTGVCVASCDECQ